MCTSTPPTSALSGHHWQINFNVVFRPCIFIWLMWWWWCGGISPSPLRIFGLPRDPTFGVWSNYNPLCGPHLHSSAILLVRRYILYQEGIQTCPYPQATLNLGINPYRLCAWAVSSKKSPCLNYWIVCQLELLCKISDNTLSLQIMYTHHFLLTNLS